jgi:hypothetical protein
VIVHQHGAGGQASKGGETAAYDLHWQALAKKWDGALLGRRTGRRYLPLSDDIAFQSF